MLAILADDNFLQSDFHNAAELRESIHSASAQTERIPPFDHLLAAGMVKLSKLFSNAKD